MWLLLILPLVLGTILEILWVIRNPTDIAFHMLIATVIVDLFLLWLFSYLVIYVYQGMIVAAVYASEIGREEGLLDNLKGNWGALFKFALLTTLFTGALAVATQALGKASIGVQLAGKVAINIIAKVYQFLTVFTVCAIVIEEMPMAKALKRSVSLVRKNVVPALFGIIISDVIGYVAVAVLFIGIFGIIGLGFLLSSVVGEVVWLGIIIVLIIFALTTIVGIALIASLVTNVYYSLVYLENLRAEGSPLLKYYGTTRVPITIDETAMRQVISARHFGMNIAAIEGGMHKAIDWWERRASKWVK
ncbi:MAG: hypothetical protein QXU48_07065 [Thermoplasmata archaeon]